MEKFTFLICILCVFGFSNVGHKEEFIDAYLSNISQSMDEKTQLLEHIQKNPEGRFIDIGTGGDSIVIMAEQLPKNSHPTLIAADIDPLVLASIKKRRPSVTEFLENKKGPRVEFLTMSATDMSQISDNSLSGISASALAHEVFSYIPKQDGLDQFLSEVCRTLEKNGVFVYRDPKWVDDPYDLSQLQIHSEIGKYYATLFLTRFLDREYSLIRDYKNECCKPNVYSHSHLSIRAYLKGDKKPTEFACDEFLKTPSSRIDYSRDLVILAPQGLIAELQRHYLMYLKDYFPPVLLGFNDLSKRIDFSHLPEDQKELLIGYAEKVGVPVHGNFIEDTKSLFGELHVLRKIFSENYSIRTGERSQILTYANVLLKTGVDKNLFNVRGTREITMDPKMVTLLFRGRDQNLFQYLPDQGLPLGLLEHLKLEGEEHYFYKTTDEIITYFAQYSRFLLQDTPKQGYCLAPLGTEYIKEAKRDLYRSLLEDHMSVTDSKGAIVQPVTEKNIIHFQLMRDRDAFNFFKSIISHSRDKFPKLKTWINRGDFEVLDLVSDDDSEVIGSMTKGEIYTKDIRNFRVVNAFLRNSKNELWIPTRNSSKRLFPLALDASVGGPVLANENYEEALKRQVKEDLGLDLTQLTYGKLGKLSPLTDNTWGFMGVYLIDYDGPIHFSEDEFIGGQWISQTDLKNLIDSGAAAKDDLKIILDRFF